VHPGSADRVLASGLAIEVRAVFGRPTAPQYRGEHPLIAAALDACPVPPAATYDVALLDLDGVVYVGPDAAPHAVAALDAATRGGMRTAFITNNASRTSDTVAARLQELGVAAEPAQVVTSAHAAARLLAETFPPHAPVLVSGTAALLEAVEQAGLRPVASADDGPVAAVVGFDPTMDYPRFAEVCLAIQRGATFVATNRDANIPMPRGPMPGMGAFAALIAAATGRQPLVAGKPERALYAEAVQRTGAARALVVGDRLDTDIAGARRAGLPAMLVLTGVSDLATAIQAPPEHRPTLIAPDLRGLLAAHPPAAAGRCGAALAEYDAQTGDGVVRMPGAPDDTVRAIVTAGWQALDAGHPATGIAASALDVRGGA
jgi:HAD superfamily hydrolase (TIGR01450 family)